MILDRMKFSKQDLDNFFEVLQKKLVEGGERLVSVEGNSLEVRVRLTNRGRIDEYMVYIEDDGSVQFIRCLSV